MIYDKLEKMRDASWNVLVACIYLQLPTKRMIFLKDEITEQMLKFKSFVQEQDITIVSNKVRVDFGDRRYEIEKMVLDLESQLGADYNIILYLGKNEILEQYSKFTRKEIAVAIRIDK